MNLNEKLQVDDGSGQPNEKQFRSLIGGLIYLAHTRPDIAFSVGLLSRFMHSPSQHHFGAAKRVLRYVVGTVQFGLWYSHESDFKLIGYTDRDWVRVPNDSPILYGISRECYAQGTTGLGLSAGVAQAPGMSASGHITPNNIELHGIFIFLFLA
ncbi:uncharacterized mitochondrial protein AtMg00810-like [Andrographis paniculata]|uniref:uncharacterized mitochondrial protein AtMg00810-like n=1 Tax=Andrographis paniculata TaxID=175694 RepID=UPI0021E91D0E|nr:uncharacterized mitochondrial protein AtMg00810-like [Andrographis paniculata]